MPQEFFMVNNKTQQGFLLIAAIVLIVIISFFAAAIVFMFTGSAMAGIKNSAAKKAFYIAESGLEYGTRQIVTQSTACSAITSTFPDPISFADGEFKISAVDYAPTPTSLSISISAAATTIPLVSAADFASQGRIVIDNEVIYYTGKSGNSLTGAKRGRENSITNAHAAGSSVKQQQCTLEAQSAVPNFSSPNAEHAIKENLFTSVNQAWSVGANGIIMYYDGANWITVSASSLTTNQLNAVSMTTSGDFGFAVGIAGTMLQFNDGIWSVGTSGTSVNLNSVFTVSKNNAWAVGDAGTILHWNGTNWSIAASPVSTNLNSISMIPDGTFGFIVGDSGTILKYNAGGWDDVSYTSANNKNLAGVDVVSPSEAWIAGAHEAGQPGITKWNGISWSPAFDDNESYNALDMLDVNNNGYADVGFAVGSAGHFAEYNGTSWTSGHTEGGDMHGMIIFSPTDAWSVGKAANELEHWDGAGWDAYTAPYELFGAAKMSNNPIAIKYMWAEQYN